MAISEFYGKLIQRLLAAVMISMGVTRIARTRLVKW
jgi:hypothetical protein